MGRAAEQIRRQLKSRTSWWIVAAFALASGIAFVTSLNAFLDQAAAALTAPPLHPVNLNQLLIRPFLLNVGLAALLAIPFVTARVERADPAAMFVASLSVYVMMLVPSLVLVASLFMFGTPEWGSILTGYLGLLLVGAAFVAVGLVIASVIPGAMAAAVATLAIGLMLASVAWLARSTTPSAQAVFSHVSIGEPLDDFAKGVFDTGTVIACLTITGFGMFLSHTLRSARN